MSLQNEASLAAVAQRICTSLDLEFGERVGAGAFKVTFRVRGRDGIDRALKVCDPRAGRARHEREMAASQRCSHVGIAKVETYSVADVDGTPFPYVLEEFLDGGTLASRLIDGSLEMEAVLAVGAGLIDALEHIAQQDLVHRDIKPENVMFRHSGLADPVLVDFGLVRDLKAKSLTQDWAMAGPGTPYYAAPEQLNNDKPLIDWRTDQFALGVTLIIAAIGRHPYGEPPGVAVGRVASRASPERACVADLESRGLGALARMVQPWPIDRFRRPEHLRSAWADQGA